MLEYSMSIQHFEDLSLDGFLDALRLEWTVYEKFDGSYFEFGLTDQGEFFSKRKGGQPNIMVSDWEHAHWTNGYRQAHLAAQQLVFALLAKGLIASGQSIGSEMIYENQTNTVKYDRNMVICITSWPNQHNFYEMLDVVKHLRADVINPVIFSPDGVDLYEEDIKTTWSFHAAQAKSKIALYSALSSKFRESEDLLYMWLNSTSGYLDLTVEQILRINLSVKDKNLSTTEWAQQKEWIKDIRDKLRSKVSAFKHIFANYVIEHYMHGLTSEIGNGSWIEGLVIKTSSGNIFKIVDKKSFRVANHFTHKLKYFLVGGQRPSRNCFVRRTNGLKPQNRVEVLDRIRSKYIENHDKRTQSVNVGRGQVVVLAYEDTLHSRTLNLFADLRKRILDGRYGV